MSYRNLFAVIERARDLIRHANQGADLTYEHEALRLSGGGLSISLPAGFSEASLTGAPEMATDVYYYYRLRDAPLAEVELRLGDSWREVTVSGTARPQVDALIGLIQGDLSRYGVRFAGAKFRDFCGVILYLTVFICLGLSLWLKPRPAKWAGNFAAIFLLIVIWFFPWAEWLPGTALFPGEASFVVRNAATISFISLLLGAAGLCVTIASALRNPTPPIQPDKPAV
jgi:hypothetical protein